MIHCIGDSHASVFSGKDEMQPIWPERSDDRLPYFRSYRIGPATAYNLFNKIPVINEVLATQVDKENDTVVFCFGEVDIRAHLIKQQQLQNKPMSELVEECVKRYSQALLYFYEQGYKIAVWTPIASWGDEKPYKGPSFGTNKERNVATILFLAFLITYLSKYNIPILSIFSEMIKVDFNTETFFLDDWEDCHIHLSQNARSLILNEFRKHKLI